MKIMKKSNTSKSQNESEIALKESEQMYRTTMMSVGDGVITTNTEGEVKLMNPVAEELTGWKQKEAQGKSLEEIFPIINEDTRKNVENPVRRVMREGKVAGLANHSVLIAKDGTEHPITDSGAPIHNEKDEITGVVLVFRDQTLERIAQKALQESEVKYRTLFENAQVGMYRSKLDGTAILAVNRKLAEIFGSNEKEMLDNPATIRWADPNARGRMVEKLKQSGFLHDYEIDILTKSEEIRNLSISVHLYPELGYLEGSAIDITGRKEAEEQIRRLNEELEEIVKQRTAQLQDTLELNQKIINSSSLGIFACKEEGPCIIANPAVARISGASVEEMLKINFRELDSWKKNGLFQKAETALRTKKVQTAEIHLTTSFGRDAWIFYYFTTFRSGGKLHFLMIVEDITERKLDENELKKYRDHLEELIKERTTELMRSRELLEEAQTMAHVGSWEFNIVKDEISGSEEFYRLFGVSKEQIAHYQQFVSLLHKDDWERVQKDVEESIEWSKPYDTDYRIVLSDSKVRQINARGRVFIDDTGKPLRMMGTCMDITERKQTEEEIRKLNTELEDRVAKRTSQLEASNKELEAFSYSVSHDLRAPLRHVSGYVELLNKHFHSELPEKGQHYLNSIADSVRLMGVLIDDLLQFSRTGRMELRESDFDMNEIVKEVIESLGKDNPDRKIEWVLGKLPSIYGDKALLRLVWMNLLSNAVKFTRTGKQTRIEIGVKKEKKELVFFVRDNGVGFDIQYAQKLFGVFQRLHPAEEFEGTGVGLANVRRIILRHGGRTWAEAELNNGAIFYFSIPKKN